MAPVNSKQSNPNNLDSRTKSFDSDLYDKFGSIKYKKQYPIVEYGLVPNMDFSFRWPEYRQFHQNDDPAVDIVRNDLVNNRGLNESKFQRGISSLDNRVYVNRDSDENKLLSSGITASMHPQGYYPYHQSIINLKAPGLFEGWKVPFFMDHPAGISDRTRRAATIERGVLANLGYMPNQKEQSDLTQVYGGFHKNAGFDSEQEMNAYIRMMKQQGYSDHEIMDEIFPGLKGAFSDYGEDNGNWLYDEKGNYHNPIKYWENENKLQYDLDPELYKYNYEYFKNDLRNYPGYKSYEDYLDFMEKVFGGDITKRITQNYIPRQNNLALSMHMQNNPNHAPGTYDKWPLVMYEQGGRINKLKLISKRKI